jgi:hypothetical protein
MNRQFWRATAERALRGAVAAVFAAYVAGDLIFNVMNVHTWDQAGSLAVGGAFSAVALSIIGNAKSGNGPSFTRAEVVPESQVPVANQRGQGGILYVLAVAALVIVVIWLVLAVFGHR